MVQSMVIMCLMWCIVVLYSTNGSGVVWSGWYCGSKIIAREGGGMERMLYSIDQRFSHPRWDRGRVGSSFGGCFTRQPASLRPLSLSSLLSHTLLAVCVSLSLVFGRM
jgi:hypothetical protein